MRYILFTFLKNNCGGVNLFMFQVFSSNLTKNKYPQRFFSRSSFMFLGRASLRNTTDWLLPKL